MDIQLAQRIDAVKPSLTLAVTAKARELKAAGRDVIGLGAGEPDFDTPDHIKAAAIQAIHDGFTKYTAVDGMPGLKQSICDKFRRDNKLEYSPNQILVSCGGKQSFYNLAQALLNPGDEVIIPAPYWVSYPDMVRLAMGTPVIVGAGIQQNFKITAEQLEKAITPKTKLFVINSPSNPTGAVYNREELQALADVLLAHPHVIIASDDMYEHIRWSRDPFVNLVNLAPALYERTLVLNGVSKAYSMTGWRIGYAAGPEKVIKAMKTIQSQSTSNPTSISQVAAQAALDGDQNFIRRMRTEFEERHQFIVAALNDIDGVQCLPSEGAFYAFPHMQGVIDRLEGIEDDLQLAAYLLDKCGIALVPGTAFGAPGYLRLSFAIDLKTLKEAARRLAEGLSG